MTVLFVCASWREIGLGHLKRCLSLANYSKDKGMKPALLVLGEEGTNNIIRKTSIEYKLPHIQVYSNRCYNLELCKKVRADSC